MWLAAARASDQNAPMCTYNERLRPRASRVRRVPSRHHYSPCETNERLRTLLLYLGRSSRERPMADANEGAIKPQRMTAAWATIIVALIGVGANAAHDISLSRDSISNIANGQMLCYIGGQSWHDGVIVPKTWLGEACRQYAIKTQAQAYALGCVYPDNVDTGTSQSGNIPLRSRIQTSVSEPATVFQSFEISRECA